MDNARLSAGAKTWFDYWGVNLKDGERRKVKLERMVEAVGDVRISRFRADHFLQYGKNRLDSGIAKSTCNHELMYLKAMFNKLLKAGYISKNPLSAVSPIKIDEYEMAYLTKYQIKRLLVACRQSTNESLFGVVWLCLATGARWSEAEKITFSQVANSTVTFTKTKSGKNRTVPIEEGLYSYLVSRRRFGTQRVFANCLSAFRMAVKRAKLELPDDQMSHVLRHTFSSHFVMNGGDILTLQKILGHSDVKMTMRYSHLSSDHLKDVVRLGPLSYLG
ncbi:MAG: tyrosine-type recombinase/integrase [Cellvibrionaceae bacterium]|nr:tyrosine-type recombinase/integrase [Cellvibrionaceae bacterium]